MNILHIISAPASGGAEIFVKDLAKQTVNLGHSVHVAFIYHAKDINRDLGFEKRFLRDLTSAGVTIHTLGKDCRRRIWVGASRVNSYVKTNGIDVCHVHLVSGIGLSAFLKIPVLYTQHYFKARWNKWVFKIFNIFVDQYVAISSRCARQLEESTGRSVAEISNAVCKERFDGLVRQRSRAAVINIIMVGRLVLEKDYLCMIDALNLLDKATLDKIVVQIAGEGDDVYKQKIELSIKESNLEQHVKLVGLQENIPEILYHSDVFLMSSVSEGLPISLIEAAISGLPSIVTDVGGCSEVIEKCNNGIVVPASDPCSMADALKMMVHTEGLIEEYSRNALANSPAFYIERATLDHIRLYESIMAR